MLLSSFNFFLLSVNFQQHSGIEKAFLFDVVSKIYIATDRYTFSLHMEFFVAYVNIILLVVFGNSFCCFKCCDKVFLTDSSNSFALQASRAKSTLDCICISLL